MANDTLVELHLEYKGVAFIKALRGKEKDH